MGILAIVLAMVSLLALGGLFILEAFGMFMPWMCVVGAVLLFWIYMHWSRRALRARRGVHLNDLLRVVGQERQYAADRLGRVAAHVAIHGPLDLRQSRQIRKASHDDHVTQEQIIPHDLTGEHHRWLS